MLLKTYAQLFGFWKTEYKEELKLSKKQKKRLRYFKNKMLKWLVAGVHCGHDKTARTCENILELQRIFTVVTSCKQQGRDVFAFIAEAIQNIFLANKRRR